MKLSLSVRIAETPTKDALNVGLDDLLKLAVAHRYDAVCLRPSVISEHTAAEVVDQVREACRAAELDISMLTSDLNVPLNNDQGPASLKNIEPHLDLANRLEIDLIRICLKTGDDVSSAQRACDQASERGIRLAHQCHTDSLFETVDGILDVINRIERPNFGIIYEPANLMLCGQDYGPAAIKRLAEHIMNVYVQNHRLTPEGQQCLPTNVLGDVRFDLIPLWEQGGVDYERMFAGLQSCGYDGYVTVHQAYASLMGPEEAAERSAEYLRSVGPF